MFEFCKHLMVACLAWALTGCGGAGGGDSSNANVPIGVGSGVFTGSSSGNEMGAVLVSDTVLSNATTPNWFGYKFTTNNNTVFLDLYSARVSGVGTAQASGVVYKHFQGPVIAGALTLSMAQNTRLSDQAVFSNPIENLNWSTDALGSAQYNPSTTPAVINGSWTGTWYFGANSSSKTLTLNTGSINGQSIMANCDVDVGSQLTPVPGANVYSVNLYVKVNTQCTNLNPSNTQAALYQGLAFVINNPTPAHATQLVIVAVSADHTALFFRGYP